MEIYNERVNQLRGTIQELINDVAKKANDNKDAAEVVRSTNFDLLNELTYEHSQPTSMEHLIDFSYESPQKQDLINEPTFGNSRVMNQTSPFNLNTREIPNSPYRSSLRNQNGLQSPLGVNRYGSQDSELNAKLAFPLRSPQSKKSSYQIQYVNPMVGGFSAKKSQINEEILIQNQNLKRMLNQEVRKNNVLLKRCKNLEIQNLSLKGELQNQKYEGFYGLKQPNFGISRSNFGRSQLSNQSELITELQYLKAQNQQLRQDTISLVNK